ncbi:MAG: acyl-CoA dehydrogenase [Microbacterium sp.]
MSPTVTAAGLAPAADLDRFLGAPDDPASPMSFERAMARDRAAEFPLEAAEALNEWGVQNYYVPAAFGGRLNDVLTPLLIMRNVARRDVTAAVGHGKTVLGAICAWAAADGSADQMARIVLGGDPVSWGLTEQGRGSDIASSTTSAALGADGIVLEGHKWPIGNATRSRAVTVLARTDERPGPRSLSLVLVDKQRVDAAAIGYRPRRALHGIRGADISGVDFHGTRVGADAMIGPQGHGLELVLKSLQLTRTLCAALSLGAGDQAIALAIGHGIAEDRSDAATRAVVADSVADLLLAEAVAYAGARCVHTAPEEMALVSAFVKFLVPDSVDLLFRELTAAIGPRAQLASGGDFARFQKASRDNRVVGIFDGNSVVNLNVVINEFANIGRADAVDVDSVISGLAPSAAPVTFDMSRLRLITRRGSSVLRALPELAARVDDGVAHADVADAARRLAAEWQVVRDAAVTAERAPQPPASQFVIAERLTLLFGAAACLALYLANRGRATADDGNAELWADGLWLRAVLARLLARLGLDAPARVPAAELYVAAARRVAVGAPVTLLPGWWHEEGAHS